MPASTPCLDFVVCETKDRQIGFHADVLEAQLLTASRSGDMDAFDQLCSRNSAAIQSTIYRLVRHREDAEDAYQETLLNAYKHLSQFRGTCKFKSWVTRIAINCSLILLRRRCSRSKVILDPITNRDHSELDYRVFQDRSPNPEQVIATQQSHRLIAESLLGLREDLRYILEQHYGEERLLTDVASSLGISEPAAKSRLLRARRALRTSLETKMLPKKKRA
jgi:RNA polymerase sigma-70 factor (ECF subfamily)